MGFSKTSGGKQDKSGSGSLLLDSKKQYAIKHWMEHTADGARQQVEVSLRDAPFQYGPFGEALSVMKPLFLGSCANLLSLPDSAMVPVNGEDSMPLDWSLVMTPLSQEILFMRIRVHFEKSTAIVENPADRRKYRLSEEELTQLRSIIVVYCSIREFLQSRMRNFEEYDRLMKTTSIKDSEMKDLIDARPARFSLSMLASSAKEAVEEARLQEESQCMEAERERVKLRDCRWQYFQAALERDQKVLKHLNEAPGKLAALKHRKEVAWRLSQAELGERVVQSYMEKFLRCDSVDKVELAQSKINEYRGFVAPSL